MVKNVMKYDPGFANEITNILLASGEGSEAEEENLIISKRWRDGGEWGKRGERSGRREGRGRGEGEYTNYEQRDYDYNALETTDL